MKLLLVTAKSPVVYLIALASFDGGFFVTLYRFWVSTRSPRDAFWRNTKTNSVKHW